jgi:hypothetical protein
MKEGRRLPPLMTLASRGLLGWEQVAALLCPGGDSFESPADRISTIRTVEAQLP